MPPLPIARRCEHSPKKSLPLCLFSKTFFFVLNVQDEEEEAADEDSVEGLRIAEEVDDGTARVLCARCFSLTHYGCARWEPARGTQQGATDCVGVYLLVQRVMMVLVPLVHLPLVCHLHVLNATAPTCKQACLRQRVLFHVSLLFRRLVLRTVEGARTCMPCSKPGCVFAPRAGR